MSVILANEVDIRDNETQDASSLKISKEITREFVVQVSSDNDTTETVKKYKSIPEIGDTLLGKVCQDVEVWRDKDCATVYHVRAVYRTPLGKEPDPRDKLTQEKIEQKVNEPPRIRSGGMAIEMVANKDIYGNYILNSAGEPFTDRPTYEVGTLFVEVTRYEPDNKGQIQAARYLKHLNGSNFWGCTRGQVKLDDLSAERQALQTERGWWYYWQVTYMFHFRRDGWQKHLVDTGMNQWVDVVVSPTYTAKDDKLAPILNQVTNQPVTSAVRLDGKGHALVNKNDPSVILDFEVYPYAHFTWLGLPQLKVIL